MDESLSSNQTNVLFQRLQLYFKIQPTVWRNLHLILPQFSSNLFQTLPGGVKLLHINIGNFKTKIADIKNDDMFQNADVIVLNETQLQYSDTLTSDMVALNHNRFIVH